MLRGLSERAAVLLGVSVAVAVPLQRHRPAVVFAACLAELVALVATAATGNLAVFAILAGLAVALAVLAATNRRMVLAVTSLGVVQLGASLRGHPTVVLGPAPREITLPSPKGLGCRVELDGRTWWVDRSAYPRLERARLLLATGGGSPGSAS